MKNLLFALSLIFLGIATFGQTLKISKATLDKEIDRKYDDEILVKGIIEIEFEIKNNTKDTLYFFNRMVEPFLEEQPFQITQTQPSIKKFAKECGGRFVYPGAPRVNYFRKLDIEEDILIILPNASEKARIKKYVDEGLCPVNGKKIEIQFFYNPVFAKITNTDLQKEIKDNEEALQILKNQKILIEKNQGLNASGSLASEVSEKIETLTNRIEGLKSRIVELKYISSHNFTREKLVSNTVYVNE